ncbi:MAG: hypothetical protein L0Z68_09940 [Gammaproteobacteria bacterium]|nr:hypothetical protein [Gammaproteobacteria bacterium]
MFRFSLSTNIFIGLGLGIFSSLADELPILDAQFAAKFESDKREYLQRHQVNSGNPDAFTNNAEALLGEVTARDLVSRATALANRWIERTESITTSNEEIGECVDRLLRKHFKVITDEDTTVALDLVRHQLPVITTDRYGINASGVTYTYGGLYCLDEKPAYTGRSGTSETHLCNYLFTELVFPNYPSNVEALAHAIIHESLHRVPASGKSFLGWPFEKYEAWPEMYARMSFEESLRNPDSYASFARDAAKCPDTP